MQVRKLNLFEPRWLALMDELAQREAEEGAQREAEEAESSQCKSSQVTSPQDAEEEEEKEEEEEEAGEDCMEPPLQRAGTMTSSSGSGSGSSRSSSSSGSGSSSSSITPMATGNGTIASSLVGASFGCLLCANRVYTGMLYK